MKPDFDRAQNAATELLLNQTIDSLYLDARNFILPDGIIIDTVQNFSELTQCPITELGIGSIDGACLLQQGSHQIILYDDTIRNEQRKHWGIIHELGHACLGHSRDDRKDEIEAHFFAAQLVSPEIVLIDICKRRGHLSDYDLYNNFNLSLEAAQKRIRTLQQRSCYNSGEIDRKLLEKFTPVLDRSFTFRSNAS